MKKILMFGIVFLLCIGLVSAMVVTMPSIHYECNNTQLNIDSMGYIDSGSNGNPTFSADNPPNLAGGSCDLDGSGDYYNITRGVFDKGVDFTFAMWIYEDTNDADEGMFGFQASPRFRTYWDGFGKITSDVGSGAEVLTAALSSSVIGNSTWVHLLFRYDASEESFQRYIDCKVDGEEVNSTVAEFNSTGNFLIGNVEDLASTEFDGRMDEIGLWIGYVLNETEIQAVCKGLPLGDYTTAAAPPPANDTINMSATNPVNDSAFIINTVNFNATVNASNNFNVSLYINGTLNETKNFTSGVLVPVNFTKTFDDGNWTFFLSATDDETQENSTMSSFLIDTTDPVITTAFQNNTFVYLNNLTGVFNISDNILLHSFNVSIVFEGLPLPIFDVTSIASTTYQYNLSYNMSGYDFGKFELFLVVSDGHTAKQIPDYKVDDGLIFHDKLKYEFYDRGGYIEITGVNGSLFDDFTSEKKTDRYIFDYTPNDLNKEAYTFEVESNDYIHIVDYPEHPLEKWLIINDKWLDFYTPEDPYDSIEIERINDNKVEVTLNNPTLIEDKITFHSIGDLNVINKTYEFYYINLTETFDNTTFTGFSFDMDLKVDFGLLEFNTSGIDYNATLSYNGTDYNATSLTFNASEATWRQTFNVGDLTSEGIYFHNWTFNFGNQTTNITSPNQQQSMINITVAPCNSSINYTILNMSYWDELTDENLNATNSWDVAIYDGTYYYNQTDTNAYSKYDTICTNVHPNLTTYNWDMWGTLTLSKPTYVTRIITIDQALPTALSNNPFTNLPLYFIGTSNSSTVTYNWLTTNYEYIDGTMRVFRCNETGSKELIESTPVISGVGYANLQLFSQAYAYDIIIDGQLFQDPTGYSLCHVESATERTFFVDTDTVDIEDLIGLASIQCSLDKITNSTINMSWSANPNNAEYVQGCLLVNRRGITGNVEVYNNCSVESDGYSRIINLPVNGNSYVVSAELRQLNRTVICADQVSFSLGDDASRAFGVSGLFAVFLLVLAMILVYAGDGEIQLWGGIVALIVAWIIGILNFNWMIVSAMMFFVLIIVLIGRYSRSK